MESSESEGKGTERLEREEGKRMVLSPGVTTSLSGLPFLLFLLSSFLFPLPPLLFLFEPSFPSAPSSFPSALSPSHLPSTLCPPLIFPLLSLNFAFPLPLLSLFLTPCFPDNRRDNPTKPRGREGARETRGKAETFKGIMALPPALLLPGPPPPSSLPLPPGFE